MDIENAIKELTDRINKLEAILEIEEAIERIYDMLDRDSELSEQHLEAKRMLMKIKSITFKWNNKSKKDILRDLGRIDVHFERIADLHQCVDFGFDVYNEVLYLKRMIEKRVIE